MKSHLTGLTIATLLAIAPVFPGRAQDAPASPAATQPEAPPPSVPRPSLVPKAAEPASPSAATEPTPSSQPRVAHRYHRRWGYYHTAYWEPFPIYLPHLYHHRVYWSRVPWVLRF